MPLKLVATAGDRAVALTRGRTLLVGRAVACDLPINDPTVSRQHAEIELYDGCVLVQDLRSTNGTYIDGERVIRALAPPGARIAFGKVDFEVQEEAPPPAPAAAPEDDSALDATILRQVPVRGTADIASRLSGHSHSLLRIGGESAVDRQAQKLELLIDIAKELSQQGDVDRLLEKVVDVTFQVMDVDRVAILLGEEGKEGEELAPRITRQRGEGADAGARQALGEGNWRVPRGIVRKAVAERVAILIENVPADLRFGEGTVMRQRVQSALCAPLLGGQGAVLGLIYVDNLGATHSFGEEDLAFLTAFSGMVSVAIDNSRLVERARREAVVRSNFQRYFAPDLAEQIGGQEGAIQLGGAKRQVVVLFSDIRGFTALSEGMSPDGIARLLTEYFTEMVEIVFEHGGTLDKFIGDALMALWGAPLDREDDADRAMRAAIAMQRALARLDEEWRRQGRPALQAGIGINVGEVFAGNIGSERRLEYTVIGDAVNTAARLCAEASPGEILISAPLYGTLASPPPVVALTPLPLKGKAEAVPVYRVEWSAPASTAPQPTGEATAKTQGRAATAPFRSPSPEAGDQGGDRD